MPREKIMEAFEQPFRPVLLGGCPAVTPPPASAQLSADRGSRSVTVRQRRQIIDEVYRRFTTATDRTTDPPGSLETVVTVESPSFDAP